MYYGSLCVYHLVCLQVVEVHHPIVPAIQQAKQIVQLRQHKVLLLQGAVYRQILKQLIPQQRHQAAKLLQYFIQQQEVQEMQQQEIAKEIGADTFEITPVQAYTNDDLNWQNNNSRVSKEHNNESLRDVALTKITPDNWASYDTVLIGYPILVVYCCMAC